MKRIRDPLTNQLRHEAFSYMVECGFLPVHGEWLVVISELGLPTEVGPDLRSDGTTLYAPAWFHAARSLYGFPERYDLQAILKLASSRALYEQLCQDLEICKNDREAQVSIIVEATLSGPLSVPERRAYAVYLEQASVDSEGSVPRDTRREET